MYSSTCAMRAFSSNYCRNLGTKAFRLPVAHASSMPIAMSGTVVGASAVAAFLWSKSEYQKCDWGRPDDCDGGDPLQHLSARCPKLNGKPLPTPILLKRADPKLIGQEFSMSADDPFKIKEKPPLPTFIEKVDPRERRHHIMKQELPTEGLELEKEMSPYVGDMIKTKTFCWVFDNVITEEQCRELIEASNQKGFVPALQGTSFKTKAKAGGDTLVFNPEFRNVYTVMYDGEEIMAWLFEALEPHLKALPVPDGWRVDHLNGFARTLCYCHADQGHKPHFDAMMKYPAWKYSEDHPWKKARSYMTFFLYLSDVPLQSGGATAFPKKTEPAPKEASDKDIRCHPKAGRVVVFSQNLYHSGCPIKDHIKYVFRSDVMCVPDDRAPSAHN